MTLSAQIAHYFAQEQGGYAGLTSNVSDDEHRQRNNWVSNGQGGR